MLAEHPLTSWLAAAELDRLAALARSQRFERGEQVFARGEPGGAILLVLSGAVRVTAAARSGAEIVYSVVQAGECFGEIGLLDGRPRSADAAAVADSLVATIARRDVLPLLTARPDAALATLSVLCDRMRRLSPQVEDALFLDTPARLANAILRHAQPSGGVELRLRATQKQLGELIGLSRESTNKQLQVWARKNWIEIEKGGVVVRDPAALSAICASPRR
jgi:CRP-like cAMP-binding protein